MSKSYKCDRCGKLMTRPVLEAGDFSVCETTHCCDGMHCDRMLNLCEECMQQLLEWMEGGE